MKVEETHSKKNSTEKWLNTTKARFKSVFCSFVVFIIIVVVVVVADVCVFFRVVSFVCVCVYVSLLIHLIRLFCERGFYSFNFSLKNKREIGVFSPPHTPLLLLYPIIAHISTHWLSHLKSDSHTYIVHHNTYQVYNESANAKLIALSSHLWRRPQHTKKWLCERCRRTGIKKK